MSGFSRILVPIDYAAPSSDALRLAATIARAFGGRLLVLHLLPIEVYGYAEFPLVAPDDARLEEERTRLERHVRTVLGDHAPAFKVEIGWGSPFEQIVERAAERCADLIVMGTHGRTGVKHAFLGSVAERTVRLARCPVLTVRDSAVEPAALVAARGARSETPPPAMVGALMVRDPVVVQSTDTLDIANARMLEAEARHLPVVAGGRLVGILSDRDLQPHMNVLAHTRVDAVMTPNPATVSPDAALADAAREMLQRRVRALPVVDGERLVGIVTSSDILADYALAASSWKAIAP
ncbi:MAG TPA: universal stress protein [Candidatus Binatia bacterium]|jgi:nucleotide-binding universal stress UspA family protein/CBS domain-containing protein